MRLYVLLIEARCQEKEKEEKHCLLKWEIEIDPKFLKRRQDLAIWYFWGRVWFTRSQTCSPCDCTDGKVKSTDSGCGYVPG